MTSVELSRAALDDLERMIVTHSLPADTRQRVARSIRVLTAHPLLGQALHGAWEGFRFILGPWRWLLIIYEYEEARDRVLITTIQDGRTSSAPDHA